MSDYKPLIDRVLIRSNKQEKSMEQVTLDEVKETLLSVLYDLRDYSLNLRSYSARTLITDSLVKNLKETIKQDAVRR